MQCKIPLIPVKDVDYILQGEQRKASKQDRMTRRRSRNHTGEPHQLTTGNLYDRSSFLEVPGLLGIRHDDPEVSFQILNTGFQ